MNKYATLTPPVFNILKNKATEAPFSGKYCDIKERGSYVCRGCGAVLFRGDSQFQSQCGWPSFDDEISNRIKRIPDADGRRTEIVCASCEGHLGHVFLGEHLTSKNTRHCVNSLSIEFVKDEHVQHTREVIVAGGCFWGVQYLFEKLSGVLLTEVGYTGGSIEYPTYRDVCSHKTGHVEALRILFDADKLTDETILKYFFEIHDPTDLNGQGPDIGSQYLSRVFYFDENQKNIVCSLITRLEKMGFPIATKLFPASIFWPAEEAHQHYYQKHQSLPYCHRYTKRFD